MIGVTVFAAMTVLLTGYAAVLYRGLLRARRRLKRAWSNLEFAWARRDGDIAKLLELCRQDDPSDQEALERVVRARTALQAARAQGDVTAVNAAEGTLRAALTVVYPIAARQVHARGEMFEMVLRALRFRIRAHERALANERERFNETAQALNARIETLPDTLIAGMCRLTPTALLEFNAVPATDIDLLGLAFSK